jgi:hypothetical protein
MKLKKIGKTFASKFVGTGPSSYEKRIYRVAVSQRLRNSERASTNCGCPYGDTQNLEDVECFFIIIFYFLSFFYAT